MKRLSLNKISIKWKLFIYISLFAAITLLLLWLFQVVFLESFYKSIKVSSIKVASNSIAKNIDSADLQGLITSTAQKSDIGVFITDTNGKLLYSEDISPGDIIKRMTEQGLVNLINEARSNNGSYLERFNKESLRNIQIIRDDFPGHLPQPGKGMIESMIYTKIATQKDGTEVAIIVNATISPVNATVETIRVQLVYVTMIMLVLALLLALFLSKRISKPIVKINTTAKELAKGNYNVAFKEDGYKEISELASTLHFAAEELSKTENLRRELIANISHDLRTPLTMISGYAEVMRDLPNEKTEENVQIIIDEAKRLTTLVNDVLDISKLQSGAQELNFKPFSLTESVKDILKRYAKLTEQDGYTIKFLYEKDVLVTADELKISQVIYNLVNNAITYTGKDKSVIVRQILFQNSVRIEVIDTGEGIDKDKLTGIWDRYYKVDQKHKRAQVGTGLGLSIVKAVLEQHKAKYGVQSTVGQGSVFWFELTAE